jgi:hypothetical protein
MRIDTIDTASSAAIVYVENPLAPVTVRMGLSPFPPSIQAVTVEGITDEPRIQKPDPGKSLGAGSPVAGAKISFELREGAERRRAPLETIPGSLYHHRYP